MENQHRQITGYRELDEDEVRLMNEIKTQGELLGHLVEKLEELAALESGIDGRWVAIGKTQLQQGLMALVRSVARPTTF